MIGTLLALMLAQAVAAQPPQPARTDAPPIAADRIILVGDSTMAVSSGWGATFCAEHVKSSVACLDLGRGGRSTRSYRQEGSWAIVLGELGVKNYRRTYVLIQFGHNDQSTKSERWTSLADEFPANLSRFVDEVRAAGGVPVLVTPLSRREFRAGKLVNTLEPWAAAVRAVAAKRGVPMLDLNADSAAMVEKLGAVDAMTLAMAPPLPTEVAAAAKGTTLPPRPAEDARLPDVPTTPDGPRGQVARKFDYTHLGPIGAQRISALVAQELARAVPELRSQLLP